MIFHDDEHLYLTFHSPNVSVSEHPYFVEIVDMGDRLERK